MNYSKFRKSFMEIKLPKSTTNYLKHPTNALKKIAITTIAATTLSLGTFCEVPVHAESKDSNSLSTVYYIYINNECIGTVDNDYKQNIEDIISKKIDALKDTYKDSQLAPNLVFVPEMVFHSASNNEAALQNVNSKLMINTKAFALQIDGKPVAFFKDEKTANEVIKQLKLKYVTEAQLNAVELRKNIDLKDLPPLKEGQSRILEIKLDKNISVVAGEIPPSQILTVAQGVKLLQRGTLEEKKYAVKDGDVLGGIAADHDLSLDELLSLNPGLTENSLIDIGDELNVTQYEPYVHVIVNEEINEKINIPFQKKIVEISDLFKGDSKVKQDGQDGQKVVNYIVSKANGNQLRKVIKAQRVTQQPINEVVLKGTKVVPSRGTGNLAWPAVGGYISSTMGVRWGRMHKGIDIARPSNRTIMAADNGVVTFAGWDGNYGNKVVINHHNGLTTVYAHLASISVNVGQTVPKGTKIGVMGETGDATGVHLHFEVYKNGALENPLNYLR